MGHDHKYDELQERYPNEENKEEGCFDFDVLLRAEVARHGDRDAYSKGFCDAINFVLDLCEEFYPGGMRARYRR